MPELPEVETVARGLHRRLAGWVIESVHLLRADIAHGAARPSNELLRGRQIEAVARTGKQVRIGLSDGQALVVHLGMTGRLTVTSQKEPLAKHTHLRIGFRGQGAELRFCDPRRFGGVWLVNGSFDAGGSWIGRRLPPVAADPLRISLSEWRGLLARRRQIKALLLDQKPISGVGNIYCDEALHRAGIHPLSRASDLSPEAVRRLYHALRRVLAAAIQAGGSSVSDYLDVDNVPGWFQTRHRVYGREGKPCRKCGTPIEKFVVSGRGTHICPKCQRLWTWTKRD
jgi:formamidopyrimidine-DNA glycosylase